MLHEIAPKELEIEYTNEAPEESDRVLCFQNAVIKRTLQSGEEKSFPDTEILISEKEEVEFPRVSQFLDEKEQLIFLFKIDGEKFYLLSTNHRLKGYTYRSVRTLRNGEPKHLAFAGNLGSQLFRWYQAHQFCGRCGKKLIRGKKEREMHCVDCKSLYYPQICPCVIIAIRDGEKLLCTRYNEAHAVYQGLSLVAGYIESGETAEEAVKREIEEEVGLRVKNIRYFTSAPWPITSSLLFGFICDLDGAQEIAVEKTELSEAVWIRREDLPDRSKDMSLTSRMMEAFRLNEI